MKIKQEKLSFSDVEDSDSDEESVSAKTASKIKVETPEPAVDDVDTKGTGDGDDDDDDAASAEEMVRVLHERGNLADIETLLKEQSLPAVMELKLKQYLKEFTNITPLAAGKRCVDIDLTDENEDTWIIQCPASVDIHNVLLNKKLNLSKPRSKIKKCSTPLETNVTLNSSERVVGLMCGTRVKSFVPAGFVRITEALSGPIEPELPTAEDSSHVEVPFPEDIRQRHPLLGYDFQEALTISDLVQERLARARKQADQFYTSPQLAAAQVVKKSKSKTKSKPIKQEPLVKIEPESEEESMDREVATVSPKKPKKLTASQEKNQPKASPAKLVSHEEPAPPPKKKKRSTRDAEQEKPPTIKKEMIVEDDISWLLNI